MKRILIIEDDQSIAELQQDYLESSGFEVQICDNGIRGLERLREGSFDLLLLDIMLPGIDGYEILRQIRNELEIPVLMVSAKLDEVDKIRCLGLGADDYIMKPFSPSELVARVKAHLSKFDRLKTKFSKSEKSDIVAIRGLEIQQESMRVFVNTKEVYLAQKEFELLLFLAMYPNKVFSRDELFEKIWGLDALGESATVTVHIARIREKTETDPSNPQFIETVWGAGYRFRV